MSLILIPNDTKGIKMRKLEMLGRRCVGTYEIFFDEVRVPAANLVGGENNGWKVANSTLAFERGMSATTSYRRFEDEYRLMLADDVPLKPVAEHRIVGQRMPRVDIPAKAANMEAAKKFVELATSPAVQADGIVKKFNWYPGIDAQHVKSQLDEKTWNKLFVDVTPQELAQKGKSFPIKPYFDDILEAYERKVVN